MDEPFVYVLTAGQEAMKIHTKCVDDIKDAVKEMLWEVIQFMDDNGEKPVYNDMLNIALHHYRNIQKQESLLTKE